jgi:hypothetical protein
MIPEIQIYQGANLIADGNPFGAGVVESIMVGGKALLDAAAFLFALAMTFYDRDTRTVEVKFTVFSNPTTRAAALDAQLRGGIGNLGVDDITIQVSEDDGTVTQWVAAASGWGTVATKEYSGYSGALAYEVTCGPFVSSGFADLDGGDDDAGGPSWTDDVDCQEGMDDDAAVVATVDAGSDD